MERGRVVIETIDSRVLQGNAMGDPKRRELPVYLPPGYDSDPGPRYPSAYVLAGFTGRGLNLLNDAWGDETLPQRLDRLINSGRMQPMIVAMPDCRTRLGGSQYINSSATGRYEDYLIEELIPFVDACFRTRADRAQRAVLGKSSGGYGAIIQAMRHPEVFGLAASHSGDLYFDWCYKPDFVTVAANLARYGGLKKFCDNVLTIRPRNAVFHVIQNAVAMASCYSHGLLLFAQSGCACRLRPAVRRIRRRDAGGGLAALAAMGPGAPGRTSYRSPQVAETALPRRGRRR